MLEDHVPVPDGAKNMVENNESETGGGSCNSLETEDFRGMLLQQQEHVSRTMLPDAGPRVQDSTGPFVPTSEAETVPTAIHSSEMNGGSSRTALGDLNTEVTIKDPRSLREKTAAVHLQPTLNPTSTLSPLSDGESKENGRHRKKVTLDDIKAVNPLEFEAENAIIKAIEEQNECDGKAHEHLLPGVPDEATSVFRTTRPPSASHTTARPWQSKAAVSQLEPGNPAPSRRFGRGSTKRLPKVEETLCDVTRQMMDINNGCAQTESVQPSIIELDEPAGKTHTQAEHFVQNASILFRRQPSKRHLLPDREDEVDLERGPENPVGGQQGGDRRRKKARRFTPLRCVRRLFSKQKVDAVERADFVDSFLKPKRRFIYKATAWLLSLWVPVLIVAFALFYAGNPLVCKTNCASWSWWIIFIFVRQLITLSLAKVFEIFLIDMISLRSRLSVRIMGPYVTLLIVQSRGWPFILLFWAVFDYILLFGDHPFYSHWLYYQEAIPLFNASNPSGSVVTDHVYRKILNTALIVAAAVAVKRLWIGISLGRKTYDQYGKQLAQVMQEMVLVSLLGTLAHEFEMQKRGYSIDIDDQPLSEPMHSWDFGEDAEMMDVSSSFSGDSAKLQQMMQPPKMSANLKEDSGSLDDRKSLNSQPRGNINPFFRFRTSDPSVELKSDIAGSSIHLRSRSELPPKSHKQVYSSSVGSSERMNIARELGAWEEPQRHARDAVNDITISAILQFRQALAYMDDEFPFSVHFGPADTRETCIRSSQLVFDRLLLATPDERSMPFETIAKVAQNGDGEYEKNKLKQLYRLFHPSKEGTLDVLDFVRSVDAIYKRLRMLRASIANSTQIDRAFERIINAFFYCILACIILALLGLDPMSLFLSLSSIIVAFAFMIGNASSKYFDGILLVLLRKPYDIGDRIHISDPSEDTSMDGSLGWYVENVDLYSTTVRFASTNEVATLSNGSLANARIINGARSPQSIIYVYLKFGVDVEFAKIKVFKASVESYVKSRPREWLKLLAFRARQVMADAGYVEYVLVLQHMESWQNLSAILNSKADLSSYCLEVAKGLQMRYVAPPLPVNLSFSSDGQPTTGSTAASLPSGLLDHIVNQANNLPQSTSSLYQFP